VDHAKGFKPVKVFKTVKCTGGGFGGKWVVRGD
jgi:hypothetical protein